MVYIISFFNEDLKYQCKQVKIVMPIHEKFVRQHDTSPYVIYGYGGMYAYDKTQ